MQQQARLDIWPEGLFLRASKGMGMVYSFPSSPLHAVFSGGDDSRCQPCRGPRRALVLPVVTAGPQPSSSALAEGHYLGMNLGVRADTRGGEGSLKDT